jgi:Zn-dependent protease
MNRRVRAGRIGGVDVTLDWSWIFAFILAAATLVSLDRQLLPHLHPAKLVLAAVAAAAGLFASLGAHELARVWALRKLGAPVDRLTLFVVGGVTNVERTATSPRAEALGALAAPAVSLAIGVTIAAGVALASAPLPRAWDDLDRLGAPGIVLAEIAAASFFTAAVNLLPAYPLDGGRLLRAALWKSSGDIERATRLAAWAGQAVGFTLVLLGVGLTIAGRTGTFGVLGIWTAFVGWFLASGAAQGYERVVARPSA